jgi:hypothetical protein
MTSPADERRVVVGVDGSQPSRLALQWAQFMAHALTATVDAVRVWEISAVEATEWSDDWDPEKEAVAALHTTIAEVLGSPPARQVVAAAGGVALDAVSLEVGGHAPLARRPDHPRSLVPPRRRAGN